MIFRITRFATAARSIANRFGSALSASLRDRAVLQTVADRLWLSNRAPSVKFFLAKQISARAAAWSWRELAAAEC